MEHIDVPEKLLWILYDRSCNDASIRIINLKYKFLHFKSNYLRILLVIQILLKNDYIYATIL